MDTDWKALSHRPIEKLSPRLWRVEGDLPNMPLKRVMSVAQLNDGRLVVHNAIAMDDASMRELDSFGDVAFIVVPNGYHRMDAPRFAKRYPKAKVLCPDAAKAQVGKVVEVHGGYDMLPSDRNVSVVHLEGLGGREGVMKVQDDRDATLVFNDAIFNMPHVPGATGFVLRHITQSTGGPRMSRIGRLFLLKDKAAFAAHLERLAALEGLSRVIVSHHQMLTEDPAAALRSVAASL